LFTQDYRVLDSGKVTPVFKFSRNKLMGANTMFVQSSNNLTDWSALNSTEYSLRLLYENEVREVLSVEILPVDGEQRFYRFVYF